MEAGLREEQPTPPPADSPQRHNSALSNAGCSSGAGASDARARLLEFLRNLSGDHESDHSRADWLLLEALGDDEVTQAFMEARSRWWYA